MRDEREEASDMMELTSNKDKSLRVALLYCLKHGKTYSDFAEGMQEFFEGKGENS